MSEDLINCPWCGKETFSYCVEFNHNFYFLSENRWWVEFSNFEIGKTTGVGYIGYTTHHVVIKDLSLLNAKNILTRFIKISAFV